MTRPRTGSAPSRRYVLAALGGGAAAALAGCNDETGLGLGGDVHYEDGEVEDVDGEERSAEELTAAESVAEQEIHEGATPLDDVAIDEHEFVLEDDYRGSTVQGTVENESGDRIELVEVRVRVYDEDGAQLGRYLDSTGDLDGGDDWSFVVILLESPDDIDAYDIAVLGTPT